MTEQEWLESKDPVAMLAALATGSVVSDRKLRLVAARIHLSMNINQKVGRAAEFLADGDEQAAMNEDVDLEYWLATSKDILYGVRTLAARIPNKEFAAHIFRDIIGNPFRPVTLPVGDVCGECAPRRRWQETWCVACHGTGHGPSPVLTPLVQSLAEAAYQERRADGTLDPDRLAVLSDTLEEAGLPTDETCCRCGGTGSLGGNSKVPASRTKLCPACGGRLQLPHPLLAHLRSPGPHYRGCWAIDLLTGRN